MKKGNLLWVEIIAATMLVILWALSAGGKLTDLPHFKGQLAKQVFSREMVVVLYHAVPASEILAAFLLAWGKTRLAGFALSALLMVLFTGYIGLVLAGYYESVPCACISLIKGMGFKSHLFFNLFFVAVALAGLILKLYSMKKFLNYLPLTALILGLGLTFSMSSFKAERVLNTYYLDQNDNTWKPLTRTFDNTLNEELEYDENSYQCTPNVEELCTGEFDSSATTIPGTVDPDGASTQGIYAENPAPVQ